MNNILHSSENSAWLTPPDICVRVQKVFGGPPDFDPASSPEANVFMEARRIITKEDDALVMPWRVTGTDSVWLNPPGGRHPTTKKSLQGLFWARLMEHRAQFGDAILLCFNLNIFQVSQSYDARSVVTFPFVVFRSRLKFWQYDDDGGLVEGASPAHPSALAYVPGSVDRTVRFRELFRDLGDVVVPAQFG